MTCDVGFSTRHDAAAFSSEREPKTYRFNTSLGLFEFQRLPYGVASAPAIFQSMIDAVLKGIPHVGCYIDNAIVEGSETANCQKTLERVLDRLPEHGITLKMVKSHFFQNAVTYFGHTMAADRICPAEAKKAAIFEAPEPTTVTELRV